MRSRKLLSCFHISLSGFSSIICLLLYILQNSSSYRGTAEIVLPGDLTIRRSIFRSEGILCSSGRNDHSASGDTVEIIIRESQRNKVIESIIEKCDRFIIRYSGSSV